MELNDATLREALKDCDFLLARRLIAEMFSAANREAERKGGQYVYKNEMVDAWVGFRDLPTLENAIALIGQVPMLFDYFEGCTLNGKWTVLHRFSDPL